MLSVIVPAYNEEKLLGRSLACLMHGLRAAGEPFEVLVVDDASTDRTAAIAREHGARVVAVSHRQISATRNSGARAARGDYLIFVDADTRADARVLRGALAAMRSGAVGGGALVRFDGPLPAYGRWTMPLLTGLMKTARLAAGCFLYCTRSAFDAAGGFDERLYGAEEIALSRALKRLGRFVILDEFVESSGRKLRAHSGFEVLWAMSRLAAKGSKGLESREHFQWWYNAERDDPEGERAVSGG